MALLPSASVSWFGKAVPATVPWLLMTVPAATPAFTRASKVIVTLVRGASVPAALDGEFTAMPRISGDTPPSGWATGAPFSVTVSAT